MASSAKWDDVGLSLVFAAPSPISLIDRACLGSGPESNLHKDSNQRRSGPLNDRDVWTRTRCLGVEDQGPTGSTRLPLCALPEQEAQGQSGEILMSLG